MPAVTTSSRPLDPVAARPRGAVTRHPTAAINQASTYSLGGRRQAKQEKKTLHWRKKVEQIY
jgi:hypothetical protein